MSAIGANVIALLGLLAALLFPAVIVVAVVVFYAKKAKERRAAAGAFLCDSCKYNTPRYCSRPERPHATECETYREYVDIDEVV